MTDVLVCIKRVPDVAGEVALTDDGQAVDARHVGFTVSAHENCAVELAVRIATDTGGTATVLTLGTDDAVEQLRTALSLGCAGAVLIEADPAGFGPADVAREIAAVVKAHEAEGKTYDLILLGNDAADTGDFQVGIRLAYELGRPVVNGIKTAAVQPTPNAERSCSTASSGPRVSTVAVPPPASAIFTASSTAQLSCGLMVNPTNRASTLCASAASSTSPEESGTRFTHTSTLVIP